MNPERAKELLPVIRAFADGQDIQARSFGSKNWGDMNCPVWAAGNEYRIKPKPREFWLRGDDNLRDGSWHVVPGSGMGAIKVREVME